MTYNTNYINELIKSEAFRLVIAQMGIIPNALTDDDSLIEELISNVETVQVHGLGGGVSGFIYYSETSAFYDAHKDEIKDYFGNVGYDFGDILNVALNKLDAEDILFCTQYFKNFIVWEFAEDILTSIDLDELKNADE